ncbi:hypothetical protein BDP81DRAFT_413464 [Colletotrichum phormii]|uniref:Uncharacterized protein n=1 Tax=Colletotrichum phormii TaxID=359342 RepID=A0AAJ0ELQ2_9PEZI|nr:uncharacterized protein BDP81DRAFT_413464 [Colletotrichum phormii]KAK1655787.1 hypothetical protein BDP81DRAFT_413464 [Colletotrichum phormii]
MCPAQRFQRHPILITPLIIIPISTSLEPTNIYSSAQPHLPYLLLTVEETARVDSTTFLRNSKGPMPNSKMAEHTSISRRICRRDTPPL